MLKSMERILLDFISVEPPPLKEAVNDDAIAKEISEKTINARNTPTHDPRTILIKDFILKY